MLAVLHAYCLAMGGGIKQPRPQVPFDPSQFKPVAPTLSALPELVVFDLDNTLWTPELYTLRQIPGYATAEPPGPLAGRDVWLLDGAAAALHELATCEAWSETKVAVASRTNKARWAELLLQDMEIPGCPGRRVNDLLARSEIYTGDKQRHLSRLHESLGIEYDRMLFFDDAKGGKYGNCEPVARMGVLSQHCPDGLTVDVWKSALEEYASRKTSGSSMGVVLDAPAWSSIASGGIGDSSSGNTAMLNARVKRYFDDKGFGFVVVDGRRGKDVFFHQRALNGQQPPEQGAAVRVKLGVDRLGRPECSRVERLDANGAAVADDRVDMATLPCFSMNMPFAALLAHGYKTIESRNHTMFEGTTGQLALLHVGKRTYPDGGKHLDILNANGVDEEEVQRLTSLPEGFSRGNIVAVLELGETTLSTLEERNEPEVVNACCAYGADAGRYQTEIVEAYWLDKPVPMKGQPGLWRAKVPVKSLPAVVRDRWGVSVRL